MDGVGGKEHGLAGTMVLGLGDKPAVSVEGGEGTAEHGRPEKRRAGGRFNGETGGRGASMSRRPPFTLLVAGNRGGE